MHSLRGQVHSCKSSVDTTQNQLLQPLLLSSDNAQSSVPVPKIMQPQSTHDAIQPDELPEASFPLTQSHLIKTALSSYNQLQRQDEEENEDGFATGRNRSKPWYKTASGRRLVPIWAAIGSLFLIAIVILATADRSTGTTTCDCSCVGGGSRPPPHHYQPHPYDTPFAGCRNIPPTAFYNGSQHTDCQYINQTFDYATPAEHAIDLEWLRLLHNYSVLHCPGAPYGGLLVDASNNTMVAIMCNQYNTTDILYTYPGSSHGETAVMFHASMNELKPEWNTSRNRYVANPRWANITLYANLESCPMCTSTMVYRGIRRYVFGARASELRRQRCNGQPNYSSHEIIEEFGTGKMVFHRGPMYELEDWILQGFSNHCPNSSTTTSVVLG